MFQLYLSVALLDTFRMIGGTYSRGLKQAEFIKFYDILEQTYGLTGGPEKVYNALLLDPEKGVTYQILHAYLFRQMFDFRQIASTQFNYVDLSPLQTLLLASEDSFNLQGAMKQIALTESTDFITAQ